MNTIVGHTSCAIDGVEIMPGFDFVVSSFSESLKGEFNLTYLPIKACKSISQVKKFFRNYKKKEQRGIEFLVVNLSSIENEKVKNLFRSAGYKKVLPVKGIVFITERSPGWHVARAYETQPYWVVSIRDDIMPESASKIRLDVESKFYDEFHTQNVCGFLKGNVYPDSFIVFSAHYDHLGMMGDVAYFPGCNDNGSGTAMVLDLARYYASHSTERDFSIAFMLFAGEEAGLKGSQYETDHPLIPLGQINSLINLDMVGSGSEGITVVNGLVYPTIYNTLDSLNNVYGYVPEVRPRGQSANSDHHPFHEKGTPSVFIYTRGKEYREYHTIHDKGPLPWTSYNGLFRLLTTYVKTL